MPSVVHPGRVQRFQVGDLVDVVHGGYVPGRGRILRVESDPLVDLYYSHCSGTSCKYWISGREEFVYDFACERVSDELTLSSLLKVFAFLWVAYWVLVFLGNVLLFTLIYLFR